MPQMLKIQGPLDPPALRVVREFPQAAAESAPDALLLVNGRTFQLEITYRRRIGAAEAWQVVRPGERQARRRNVAVLAIADRTTEEARRILADNGIAYVDGVGNAHFDLPGVYVHVERLQPKQDVRGTAGKPKLAGKAGVVVQALLLEPDREWRVTDLAERADVSLGLAYAVLDRLEDLQIVEARGGQRAKARRVVNPTALLDTWVEENRDHGFRRLGVYVLPPRGGDPAAGVARRLRENRIEHALTGVAAAAALAPFLTAISTTTFWVDEAQPLEDVAALLQAEVTDRGANTVLMQARDNTPLAFAQDRGELRLANVFRIYYDARRDPKRGREQAEHLRAEVIGW